MKNAFVDSKSKQVAASPFFGIQNNKNEIKRWLGIVVDNKDPLKEGRCRCKVFGKWDDLSNEELPWCYPINGNIFGGGEGGSGSFVYPKLNHFVVIIFDNDDDYHPFFISTIGMNSKMKEKFSDSYENCQVLSYDEDEDLRILYTQKEGLMLWSKESFINIDKGQNVKIFHKGGPSKIDLIEGDITEFSNSSHYIDSPAVKVGNSANHPDTKCDTLFDLLGIMAKAIDAKMPSAPGVVENVVKMYKMQVCSDVVKIA